MPAKREYYADFFIYYLLFGNNVPFRKCPCNVLFHILFINTIMNTKKVKKLFK